MSTSIWLSTAAIIISIVNVTTTVIRVRRLKRRLREIDSSTDTERGI